MVVIAFTTVLFFRRGKGRWLLVPLIVAGIIFVMPVLARGRYATSPWDFFAATGPPVASSLADQGDYSAFGNIALTLRYVNDIGPTWGRRFLRHGRYLSPRVGMWPKKPVGCRYRCSGYRYGLPIRIFSSPFPAKDMINFGIFGVAIFGVLCGALVKRLDADPSGLPTAGLTFRGVVYPCWLGLFFPAPRGNLLSSFAFAVGTTCAALPLCVRARNRGVIRRRGALNGWFAHG